MATRKSINARAKKFEREVQQYLWPGSSFAGGAKRPALEDEDLRGPGMPGMYWWGECKSVTAATLNQKGVWAILDDALTQCEEAIRRNHTFPLPPGEQLPNAFAVCGRTGCSLESNQVLVMLPYYIAGTRCIIPLREFKKQWMPNP